MIETGEAIFIISKMKEKDVQIKFKHWVEANPPSTSTAYELKLTKGGTFNLASWVDKQPHQLRGLLLSSLPGRMCYHKISDASFEQKPWDCVVMANAEAYLVIYYFKEHQTVMVKPKLAQELLTEGVKGVTFNQLLERGAQQIKL